MNLPVRTGLAPADAARVAATLERLRGNGLADFALTGGVAMAARLAGEADRPRPLADLDVVVAEPASLPGALADGFLVGHVHPAARPGRMVLQLVDPATALRVDLFGGTGGLMGRSGPGPAAYGGARIASRSDLVARLTRLLLDLALGEAVAAKHARDFAALLSADPAHLADLEGAWIDHRREHHPESFGEARRIAEHLVRSRADLLVGRVPFEVGACPLCRETGMFRPSPPDRIVAVLGHP